MHPQSRPFTSSNDTGPSFTQGNTQSVRHLSSLQQRNPSDPALRANPYPEVTDLFCRLPLSTFFYLTIDCSSWRPDAVMSTTKHANENEVLKLLT